MKGIGGGWYMETSARGLPPLRRTKLSKKHKKVRIKLKYIYEANEWWNDWRFQLHWHKLE